MVEIFAKKFIPKYIYMIINSGKVSSGRFISLLSYPHFSNPKMLVTFLYAKRRTYNECFGKSRERNLAFFPVKTRRLLISGLHLLDFLVCMLMTN